MVVEEEKPINYRKFLIWTIVVILGLYFFGCSKKIFNQSADMYNKSKICHNNYTQKVDEKKGFYDKQWKTYRTKENIANFVTKEVYHIPFDTLFNKIFEVMFVIMVPMVLSWIGTALYGELNGINKKRSGVESYFIFEMSDFPKGSFL